MKRNLRKSFTATIAFLIFSSLVLSGQIPLAEIEGHIKVRGLMDVQDSSLRGNLSIGTSAGSLLSLGAFNNTFVGIHAGQNNIGGDENTFVGYLAGRKNIDSDNNSFFGTHAGRQNTNGWNNTFLGHSSGYNNTLGEENVFTGYNAGKGNIRGGYNSMYGSESGLNSHYGSYNTFIGAYSGLDDSVTNDSLDRSMAFGYNAKVACHNCAVIGGTAEDAVKVGIGTISPGALLHIESNDNAEMVLRDIDNEVSIIMQTRPPITGLNWVVKAQSEPFTGGSAADASIIFQYAQDSIFRLRGNGNATLAGTLTENSDARLKTHIEKIRSVLPQLLTLHAYTYEWKDKSTKGVRQVGLMAQEVRTYFPELVQEDENGILSVSYTRFVPILIEALREQELKINALEEKLASKAQTDENPGDMIDILLKDHQELSRRFELLSKKIETLDEKSD